MNPTSKKFISLFLIFSLIEISCAPITFTFPIKKRRFPERKQGAIVITKTDGQQIEGELITVKLNSLLLLDTEGKDVSVDIGDIKVIRIVKKSKALLGAGLGLLIVGGGGALLAVVANAGHEPYTIKERAWLVGIFGGLGGLLIGGIVGAGAGKDKKIQIEGMSDLYIQETLDKLRKKARIRDYK
jgi:hypothetical protein